MAHIEERDGKFRIQIRKKGMSIYKTFSDKETAELFVWYREKIIDEMSSFEVPTSDLVTIKDLYEIRLKDDIQDRRELFAIHNSFKSFMGFFKGDSPISDITFEKLDAFAVHLLKSEIRVGGNRTKISKGVIKLMAPKTAIQRLSYFSAAISYANKQGIKIQNPLLQYMTYFRNTYIKTRENPALQG